MELQRASLSPMGGVWTEWMGCPNWWETCMEGV